jgi:glyoxylase-like metal-dependent hydrolase (beta-lactamase superfamily II)
MTRTGSTSPDLETAKIAKVSDSVFKLGPLGSPKILCSYLVLDEKVSVIDCGPSVVIEELLALVDGCGVRRDEIDYLLLTHVHIDHAGGTSRFLEKCKKAKAFVPRRGYKHLLDPEILNRSAKPILGKQVFNYWGKVDPVHASRLAAVDDEQTVSLGKRAMKYIEATGHAPHHDILYEAKDSILFAADALGIFDDKLADLRNPTSPPPSFDLDQALKDIAMIQKLEADLVCLPHFKVVKPDMSFYEDVRTLYETWQEKIGGYILKKGMDMDSIIDARAKQDIFSILAEAYPSYELAPEAMKYQIMQVDIVGFVQSLLKRKQKTG